MKCCSRSTLGVVIGILNLIAYAAAIIIAIAALIQVHSIQNPDKHDQNLIDWYNMLLPAVIVVCLIMSVISALLITGIVKRRHNLMLPWIIVTAIGFIINCARIIYTLIVFISAGVNIVPIIMFLLLSLLGVALSGLILWAIYNLYKDIREENANKIDRVTNPAHVQYNLYKP